MNAVKVKPDSRRFVPTEPAAVAGGAVAGVAAAILQGRVAMVLPGAGHPAISGLAPPGAGAVLQHLMRQTTESENSLFAAYCSGQERMP